MSATEARHGLGDPRIPWVVLLDVAVDPPPDRQVVAARLADLAGAAGWAPPSADAVSVGDRRTLLGALCSASAEVLRVGVHDRGLVLSARHDSLDGLAMLTALGRLLADDVRSSARGVDPEGRARGGAASLVGRAWEVAARPQARVAASAGHPSAGDVFAAVTIDAEPRTADLVRTGARAVATWNRRHGARDRRVSVAVGVSTVGGASTELTDHSGFVRLRHVEAMSPAEVRAQLAGAPLQVGGAEPALPRPVATTVALALRAAAPRLGSTLLVSHLGAVSGPPELGSLAFYPVTGGGSGLSLGAATLRGRTTLTLRARGSRHDDEGLQELLALVVAELEAGPGHLA